MYGSIKILAAALVITLSGCSGLMVKNCSARPLPSGGISFKADVFALSGAQKVYVFAASQYVELNGEKRYRYAQTTYAVGPVKAGRWSTVTVDKSLEEIRLEPYSYSDHLLPITACFAAAVIHEDGTYQQLYSPL